MKSRWTIPGVVLCLSLTLGAMAQSSGKQTEPPEPGLLARWFELQSAMVGFRYRLVENSRGETTLNQGQHKEAFRARLRFDPQGKVTLNGLVSSGGGATSSWNDTGWGTGETVTNLHLTQLYLALAPVKGLEIQYGGITAIRGKSTEITTYDVDNYMMGGRLSLRRPGELFFDEIAVTFSHLGDTRTPNINKRFHRLAESNYHQFLVAKQVHDRVGVSVDYTFHEGRETLRQGVAVKLPESRVLDSLTFEAYERVDVQQDFGFAVHGEKAVHPRLRLGGGYADIDRYYGGLNADRFDRGRRLFLVATVPLAPNLGLETFIQRAVANDFPLSNRLRLDVIVTYNLVPALKQTGLF
ncbi:MAG: hypothetical protein Kow001_05700 [Acidobacteriota bacterium]